jgi:hypothetical protein
MIESPKIGDEYFYVGKGGFGTGKRIAVRVTGFCRAFVITEGVEDKRRRDVPRSRLEH